MFAASAPRATGAKPWTLQSTGLLGAAAPQSWCKAPERALHAGTPYLDPKSMYKIQDFFGLVPSLWTIFLRTFGIQVRLKILQCLNQRVQSECHYGRICLNNYFIYGSVALIA